MIDFGFAQGYLSAFADHLEFAETDQFMGNYLFQSPNAFRFKTLSRRDDLISLTNILAFYFVGEVTWYRKIKSDRDLFYEIQQEKLKQTPETIC